MADLHVVFGTGPVGRAVMRELLGRGKNVRVVNRSGSGSFPAAVELCPGDASDRRFTREACAGAAVVYQCVAPPYHRWPELFPRLQAGVLEGAAAADARLVAMENVYMYGSPYGKPLTERNPMTAMTRKGRVRAEMAQQLLHAHAKGRVRVAIGRASDFFGPEVIESAMGARVFRRALRGQAVNVVGNVKLPHTYGYVPDIARGLAILGQRDEALGEVWHLPGPETVTTAEFLSMVFAEAEHRPQIRSAGSKTLRALGFFKPQVREMVEMMYQFEEPFVVEHDKFVDTFGDISTPLTEAIRATVDWYRAQEPTPAADAVADDADGEAEKAAIAGGVKEQAASDEEEAAAADEEAVGDDDSGEQADGVVEAASGGDATDADVELDQKSTE